MSASVPSTAVPAARRTGVRRWVDAWNRIGDAGAAFYARTLASSRRRTYVATAQRLVRLIAQMGLGTGALAVIGGTVVIVGVPDVVRGLADRDPGLQPFSDIGVEALTGFVVGLLQRAAWSRR